MPDRCPVMCCLVMAITLLGTRREKGSGVATFSKVTPDEVIIGLGVEQFDREGRTITTRFGDVMVVNCYFPHGQRDHARHPFKTEYYRTLLAWAQDKRAAGFRVVIAVIEYGSQAIDIKNDKANRKTSGFTEPERALIDEYIELGWHDTFRRLHPDAEDVYSWWSNRAGVRERNVGWRMTIISCVTNYGLPCGKLTYSAPSWGLITAQLSCA